MEIDDSPALGGSPTPPLPDGQTVHPLQLAADDVETYISSLPKKEQLSTALQILQQSLAQRATLLQQQHNLTTQMDVVNAQLMQYQLEHNDLRASYDDLQSRHNKLLTGSTFLTSYTTDPLAAPGITGLNELHHLMDSASNSLLYNKGTAVIIPKQLKGN